MERRTIDRIKAEILPWKIERTIGSGSFGSVYEISREEFGNRYTSALKVITIPQSDAEIRSLMDDGMDEKSTTAYYEDVVSNITKECALMAKFKGNSNIVSYEDHQVIKHKDRIGWDILIRMELLTPLADYIKTHPVNDNSVIKLGIDICKALELCCKNNVIHRDIKPANIFVAQDGSYKLGDFGIARTIEQSTGNLSKSGTASYMAPEVYRGGNYSYNVDLYSLGLVMYWCMNCNRTPFLPHPPQMITAADKDNAMLRRMRGEPIPRPINGSDGLVDIVVKACSFNIADRFSSPTQMRIALENLKNQTGQRIQTSKKRQAKIKKKNEKRKKKWLVPVVAGILALAAACGVYAKLFLLKDKTTATEERDQYIFTLSPDVTTLRSKVKDTIPMLESRLNVLGNEYKIEEEDATIKLSMSKSMLPEDGSAAEKMMDIILSKGNFNLIAGYAYSEFTKDNITDISIKSDKKSDFMSYYSDEIDALPDDAYDFDRFDEDAQFGYLELKFDRDGASDIAEAIEIAEITSYNYPYAVVNLATGLSVISEEVRLGIILLDETDPSHFVILPDFPEEDKMTNLIAEVIKAEDMDFSYTYTLENDMIYESGDEITGKNQQESISGKHIDLEYSPSYIEIGEKFDTKFNNTVKMIKKRLDTLGEPYAIGYRGLAKRSIIVSISPDVLGSSFAMLLGGSGNVEIRDQFSYLTYASGLKYKLDSNGIPYFEAEINKYSASYLVNKANQKIYLVVNDITVGESVLPEIIDTEKDLKIDFKLSYVNQESVGKNGDRLGKFTIECSNTPDDSPITLDIEDTRYLDGESICEDDIEWGYDCLNEIDTEIKNKITQKYSNAFVDLSSSQRNCLLISLDIKRDDNFVKNFTNTVKDIYTMCNFDDGTYANVRFYVKGEWAKNPADRCRIGWMKYSGEMTGYCFVEGPNYTKYSKEFDDIIESDRFFSKYDWYK
ncbi:MAG: serine/threonine protein kinase [Oscillospiraceae bacterium]|nr:serine/threonine protein kinase [Oscillospiraceae bacterium]